MQPSAAQWPETAGHHVFSLDLSSSTESECPEAPLPQGVTPARVGQGLSIRGHSKAGCSQDRDVDVPVSLVWAVVDR